MVELRKRRAGIAQLVEQATENRRVPSSNLGPGMSDQQQLGLSPLTLHFQESNDAGAQPAPPLQQRRQLRSSV